MIGSTLGHYEILGALGKGGMGEVYRARDTKLGREVAIKVLPKEMSGDPERAARFDREARLLASLQHAHIASIYGFEHADGVQFLAMELVEGQTLEDRLREGALPHDEVLRIGRQMAAGMEAAHDKSIVHRDLKPANVMLTREGDVKILDFGLARAWFGESPDEEDIGTSPTITAAMTQAGTILGTAAYMSPEQARGKHVDRRADIWAFGAILWEMVTGHRLFQGETVSDTLAAVIRAEPEWDALPLEKQPTLCRLIERCLVRDPRQRLRDIGEARIQLQEAIHAPQMATPLQARPTARSGWLARAPWLLAAAATAAAIWLALSTPAGREQSTVMRFALSTQDELEIDRRSLVPMAVSPDGNTIVLVADGEAGAGLYLREVGRGEASFLGGTEGASDPIYSPDGRWIAFEQGGMLRKVSVSGGPPMTLCDAPNLRGASWSRSGQIVFAPGRATGLMLVAESGGAAEPLTELEQTENSLATPTHRWPEFLPDGKTVLFTKSPDDNDYDRADIVAVPTDGGEQKLLVKGGSFGRYVSAGFLVFLRQNTLFAARFSPERVELLGAPTPVLEQVAFAPRYGNAQLSFSETGLLLYLTDSGMRNMERLIWLDRQGRKTPASAHERVFQNSRISPDGRRAVLEISEAQRANLWMLEFSRDSMTRFTFDEMLDRNPVWSPDGNWIAFSSFRGSPSTNIFRKRSNGTGEVERLTQSPNHQNPHSWSPDGNTLAVVEQSTSTRSDILLLHLDADPPETEVFLRTPFEERDPCISTDGAWIAYVSNETGQQEVYVRPLSGNGAQVKISQDGGAAPAWSPDGPELIYNDTRARKLMAVQFSVADGELVPELAREICDYPRSNSLLFDLVGEPWRILADEELEPAGVALHPPAVIVNWFEELEQKVPLR